MLRISAVNDLDSQKVDYPKASLGSHAEIYL